MLLSLATAYLLLGSERSLVKKVLYDYLQMIECALKQQQDNRKQNPGPSSSSSNKNNSNNRRAVPNLFNLLIMTLTDLATIAECITIK